MGCQGDIYNIYGVIVPVTIVKNKTGKFNPKGGHAGFDNPVVYEINGHTITDDQDNYLIKQFAEKYDWYEADDGVEEVEFYNGIDSGLSIRIIGHHSYDMGSRHFKGTALVGYEVCNECYLDKSTELPDLDEIVALKPKLIEEIKNKLGLDIDPDSVRLHLLFDSLNGY